MTHHETITADLYPSLTYEDAPAAIEWLCRAFGFTRRLVVPGEDGTVLHSELSFGNGVIMVSSTRLKGDRACHSMSVFVADPDAHHAQAVPAGAEVVRPLTDEEYGARGYMVKDPEGNLWWFGNYRPGAHWTSAETSTGASG